jgi:hypothetical protein
MVQYRLLEYIIGYLDTNDSDKLSFSLNNKILKSIESGGNI